MREQVKRFLEWVRGSLKPAPGRECFSGYHAEGVAFAFTPAGSLVGECRCGFKFAARSRRSFVAAILSHLEYRAQ